MALAPLNIVPAPANLVSGVENFVDIHKEIHDPAVVAENFRLAEKAAACAREEQAKQALARRAETISALIVAKTVGLGLSVGLEATAPYWQFAATAAAVRAGVPATNDIVVAKNGALMVGDHRFGTVKLSPLGSIEGVRVKSWTNFLLFSTGMAPEKGDHPSNDWVAIKAALNPAAFDRITRLNDDRIEDEALAIAVGKTLAEEHLCRLI